MRAAVFAACVLQVAAAFLLLLLASHAFAAEDTASPVQALVLDGHKVIAADVPVPPKSDIGEPLQVAGHPLTSVVITQCNLIVAVYMTMPDGRLLRFDKSAQVTSDALMQMAYAATRSQRVEVSCNGLGVDGTEAHDPV